MSGSGAIAAIDRLGIGLAEHLFAAIDPVRGGFGRMPSCVDVAAHQLVWRHYMMTGKPAFGDAVIASLRAICRSLRVDPQPERTLGDHAQLLELLTWVWRQARCSQLRDCAEDIATRVVGPMRVPGFGFAGRRLGGDPDKRVPVDRNGLMLVALVEAGSVFERRDWLAQARQVFDELVGRLDAAGCLDDHAMMSRAAIRLFEAFGKPRYLELAETWVAMLDDAFWDADNGGYRMHPREVEPPTIDRPSITDATLPSGNALMIGVLARLHALTGRYADRAERLVEAFRGVIPRSGIAGATAVANVQTLAQLVVIEVSGDPKLPETRELMRTALDCALPDRLVLGPGAGDPADTVPKALVRLGTRSLAPITDAAQLRALTSPAGLSDASRHDTAPQRLLTVEERAD